MTVEVLSPAVEAIANAKINLTLHVTGQRDDGYHLLDSLVMFADVADVITVQKSEETSLAVTGPMAAGVPADSSNLVLKAAALMGVPAKITLEKHLPAASGIGGGSADAAAVLRALSYLYELPLPKSEELLSLGADVPVCLEEGVVHMAEIGEALTPAGDAGNWPMLLVNPRVEVSTPEVFKALDQKDNAPMSGDIPVWGSAEAIAWLAAQRNDLEAPAIAVQPVIGDCLAALRNTSECALARMSGSGATCFGIYETTAARDAALQAIRSAHPDWWAVATQPA